MMKKLYSFLAVVFIAAYVVKNPGETVDGIKYAFGQISLFWDAL